VEGRRTTAGVRRAQFDVPGRRHGAETMIARTWHGITPAEKADEYFGYLQESGVKAYRATEGNRGVYVLRRLEGDRAHFLLITFWDSWEPIRAFAGEDFERARYFPRDADFLLEFEPNVTQYEILATPDVSFSASRNET